MRTLLLCAGLVMVAACGSPAAQATPSRAPATTAARASAPATVNPQDHTPCPAIPSSAATKSATLLLANGGTIKLALRPDKAPNTVTTFLSKASAGFYNGLTFHRVVADFVAQGGDPAGNGTGGGNQPTELSDLPFCVGSLGIARGNDTKINNDSQFFICISACRFLDRMYTNFGQVTAGMDVASAIKVGDKIKTLSAP